MPIFLLLYLIGSIIPLPHEFHMSKCQVDYVAEEKALQISMHLFIDDLEEALRNNGHDLLFLCTNKENPEAEKYLQEYLRLHFKVQVNDNPVDFEFIGKEISDDLIGVWCYLEIAPIDPIANLQIVNDVLIEVFEDQKNILSVTGPQKKKGYFLLQKGRTTANMAY